MKNSKKRMMLIVIIASSLIVPAIWFTATLTTKEESPSQGQAAQKAHIDPETGQFIKGPKTTPAAERAADNAAFNTSDEGLVETSSPVEGGGTMVDLQGRFRSPLTAKVGEDGKAIISHEPIDHEPIDPIKEPIDPTKADEK